MKSDSKLVPSMARRAAAAGCRAGAGRLRDRAGGTAGLRHAGAVQGAGRAAGRGHLDARAARRGAAARRMVEGLQRPGARRRWSSAPTANNTSIQSRGRAAGRRRAPCCAATDADRAPQVGAGRRRQSRQAGTRTATERPAAHADHGRRRPLVRARPVRHASSTRQRRRAARCRGARRRCCRARACWCRPSRRRPTSRCARSTPSARWCARPSTAYRDTLRLTERRYRAGDVAELDVARVRDRSGGHRVRSAGARPPPRRARARAGRAGRRDGVELRLATRRLVDRACRSFPAGVPATVLDAPARRLGRAEARVLAAQARVGVAQAAWFPDISLTGGGGYRVAGARRPVQVVGARRGASARCCRCRSSTAAAARPACRAPRAQLDGALADYREQVLVAFKDVEDQLSALRMLERAVGAQARAVDVGEPRDHAVGFALPQRAGQPARPARRAPQRTAATAARRCRCARRSTRRRWA